MDPSPTYDLPDLDYAFVAEYGRLEANGTLTAIGASFTRLHIQAVPASGHVAICGRVRLPEEHPRAALRLVFSGTSEAMPTVDFTAELAPNPDATFYCGRTGVVFAVNVNMPLLMPGDYTVQVYVGGKHARTLKFQAGLAEG